MSTSFSPDRSRIRTALVLTLAIAAAGASAVAAPVAAAAKPTIVLVHGAFADASSFNYLIPPLQKAGYRVVAPANPLRGVSSDAAYLAKFLGTIRGPIVLVGHSYGGAVITNAATGDPDVKALVYLAAFAPDAGETILSLGEAHPGGQVTPSVLDLTPYVAADGSEQLEGIIKPRLFRRIVAGDLPAAATRTIAATQRPAGLAAFAEPSGAPAWKAIPSWYLAAGKDRVVGIDLERFMARRMKAKTTEIDASSHVVMVSHAAESARFVLRAARTVR